MPVAVRARAIAEVLLIMGLIFLIIWVVKPLDRPVLDLSLRIVVAGLILGSAWFHGDSRERLGLRLDNFWKALARVLPLSILVAGLSVAAGFFFGAINPPTDPARQLAYYFAWASAQQYTLQSVVLLRLENIGLRGGSPLAAAALFSLVHAPNPGLMVLTFLGAALWCSTFRKDPNILALALSHAILAVVVASTLPPAATGAFKIGPAYLRAY